MIISSATSLTLSRQAASISSSFFTIIQTDKVACLPKLFTLSKRTEQVVAALRLQQTGSRWNGLFFEKSDCISLLIAF
jgi:hypothetical protein